MDVLVIGKIGCVGLSLNCYLGLFQDWLGSGDRYDLFPQESDHNCTGKPAQ